MCRMAPPCRSPARPQRRRWRRRRRLRPLWRSGVVRARAPVSLDPRRSPGPPICDGLKRVSCPFSFRSPRFAPWAGGDSEASSRRGAPTRAHVIATEHGRHKFATHATGVAGEDGGRPRWPRERPQCSARDCGNSQRASAARGRPPEAGTRSGRTPRAPYAGARERRRGGRPSPRDGLRHLRAASICSSATPAARGRHAGARSCCRPDGPPEAVPQVRCDCGEATARR